MHKIKTTAGKRAYRWDYQELRFLVFALTQAKDFQESLTLFLDLHTRKEMSEIIRRIIMASYLSEGKTYQDIQTATGASANTISKMQQRLLRQKSILPIILKRVGTLRQFEERTAKRKDPIRRKLDRFLTRSTLGLINLNQ